MHQSLRLFVATVTALFSSLSMGKTLDEIARARLRQPGYQNPSIYFQRPPDSPHLADIDREHQRLAELYNRIHGRMLIPDKTLVEITRGRHFLDAVCRPYIHHLEVDETAWSLPRGAGSALVPGGLIAHEAGHDLFVENVMALLEDELGASLNTVTLDALVEKLQSDASVLEKSIKDMERLYPSLVDLNSSVAGNQVPHEVLLQYRTFRSLQSAHRGSDPGKLNLAHLTGKDLAFQFLMEGMGGLQEVYADLMAVIHTNHESVMAFILNDPLGMVVRDFGVRNPLVRIGQDATLWNKLLSSASRGVPHLLLVDLRQQIYKKFYTDFGIYPGTNPTYDVRVLQEVLESFVRTFVRVYVKNPPPRVREAAAALALVYEVVVGDVTHVIEERANAIGREFLLRKVVFNTGSAGSYGSSATTSGSAASGCAKEIVVPKAATRSANSRTRENGS